MANRVRSARCTCGSRAPLNGWISKYLEGTSARGHRQTRPTPLSVRSKVQQTSGTPFRTPVSGSWVCLSWVNVTAGGKQADRYSPGARRTYHLPRHQGEAFCSCRHVLSSMLAQFTVLYCSDYVGLPDPKGPLRAASRGAAARPHPRSLNFVTSRCSASLD